MLIISLITCTPHPHHLVHSPSRITDFPESPQNPDPSHPHQSVPLHAFSDSTDNSITETHHSPITDLMAHTNPDSQIKPTAIPHSSHTSGFINLQSLTPRTPPLLYQSNRLITTLTYLLICSSLIRSRNAGHGLTRDGCHIHTGELSGF